MQGQGSRLINIVGVCFLLLSDDIFVQLWVEGVSDNRCFMTSLAGDVKKLSGSGRPVILLGTCEKEVRKFYMQGTFKVHFEGNRKNSQI